MIDQKPQAKNAPFTTQPDGYKELTTIHHRDSNAAQANELHRNLFPEEYHLGAEHPLGDIFGDAKEQQQLYDNPLYQQQVDERRVALGVKPHFRPESQEDDTNLLESEAFCEAWLKLR